MLKQLASSAIVLQESSMSTEQLSKWRYAEH